MLLTEIKSWEQWGEIFTDSKLWTEPTRSDKVEA